MCSPLPRYTAKKGVLPSCGSIILPMFHRASVLIYKHWQRQWQGMVAAN